MTAKREAVAKAKLGDTVKVQVGAETYDKMAS